MNEKRYYEIIDMMTLKHISEGKSFELIVQESLGASPIDIKKSLKRLMDRNCITSTQYENLLQKSGPFLPKIEKEIYITHMLDGDWKFNCHGIQNILETMNLNSNSLKGKKIAFMGTPTLFRECILRDVGTKRVLIDKNARHYERFAFTGKDDIIDMDIMSNSISDRVTDEYDVVVMDPPWYFDVFLRFILEAKKILKQKGVIYCVYPQEYTRPTIQDEYHALISKLRNYNITVKAHYKRIVSYTTPLFEEVVLNHEGIALQNRDWRYADLLCFEYNGGSSENENFFPYSSKEEWGEVRVCDVCFKYRKERSRLEQSSIIESPFADAVLPTFSARDCKLELEEVNLWTSSNHVYRCGDLTLFIEILNFIAACDNCINKDLILEHIKTKVQYETSDLIYFVDHVADIINKEIDIAKRWIASYNKHKSFFVSDYDGTIKCGNYTNKNVQILREIAKMQHTGIIICSERTFDYLKRAMSDMNVPVDYFVCSNGAEIYDKNGHCIDSHPLTDSDIKLLHFLFDGEDKISKVVKQHPNSQQHDLLWLIDTSSLSRKTSSQIKHYLNCFMSGDKILVSAKDASKGQALARLREYGVETSKYIGNGDGDIASVSECGAVLLKSGSDVKRAAAFQSFCDRFILERQLLDSLISCRHIAEYHEILHKRNYHLAVFTEPYLSYIKLGKKTLESRFSTNRIAPYGKVKKGDYIFVKRSSGKVEGFFKADEVLEYMLDDTTFTHIKEQYEAQLCVDEVFWSEKKNAKYATIIRISDYCELVPFDVLKKDMLGWVSL